MGIKPSLRSSPHENRRVQLRARLKNRGLDFLVVTNSSNIFYLTGFRGSAGAAVIGGSETVLWVDPRYTLQAKQDAVGVEVIEVRGEILKAAAQWLRKNRSKRVGVESDHITSSALLALERYGRGQLRFVQTSGVVEALRVIKDAGEIQAIREAAKLTVEVFEGIRRVVRPGARERDLAAAIEFQMRMKGAEGPAFETIVASGPRAALPHARASERALKEGELVIFDMGAILSGYAADMTRTVFLGRPNAGTIRLYDAVMKAQCRAVDALRPGVRSCDVDFAARHVLERRGLAKFFTHSTGHGVGLDVHEKPRLGRRERFRLKAGVVVTAEPGIYLEGVGGIRLEDTVLVREGGPEVLTPASMDHWIIS